MTAVAAPQAPADLTGVRLTFPRLVRSEWIKLRTIRSTVWCFAILFVLNVGLPVLVSAVGHLGDGKGLTGDAANAVVVQVATLGVNLTSLVVAVLGVLIMTGEYTTGMIRATFTADPGRLGAVFAKALVLAVTTFVLSAASTWIGVALAAPTLEGKGVAVNLGESAVVLPILGSSVYVTLLALLAFGIGLLVRTTAGGIAITLGLLLVVPTMLQVIGGLMDANWLLDVNQFLPSEAGRELYSYDAGSGASGADTGGDVIQLNGWSAFGVTAGLTFLVGAVATVLAKRRDA
ncbi:ABC transporter permease subunit [Gryllotalpicola ginsengisoli]|uniref:ABC transporter permease subunit n=1 Tax=Gryllotalpicola ginsengisoli TaxID=444608 RepID=UPI0003B38DE1|nr:ABC transporter permease subunit [Gryllotalpicola ginsengisoli]